ncbi:MAG: leucine-rich repeat domain-containing protein [Candidatus Hodarchaeota archaeon]
MRRRRRNLGQKSTKDSEIPEEVGVRTHLDRDLLNLKIPIPEKEFLHDTGVRTNCVTIENHHITKLLLLRTIKSPPKSISNLTKLEELDYISDFLGSVLHEICTLTNLKILRLSNHRLKELPTEVGTLTKLEVLDLSHNELKTLPDLIRHLTKLKNLKLCGNNLETLPETIGTIKSLEVLTITNPPVW